MKQSIPLAVVASAILLAACESAASDHTDSRSRHEAGEHDGDGDDEGESDGEEVALALTAIPPAVSAAAIRAFPGLTITEATKETEDGHVVYSLEGLVNGVEYEIELSEDGRILEAEQAGDDDED